MKLLGNIKTWYNQLTKGENSVYSLSDTQFFWITIVWLVLFPFVAYAIFFLALATWKEFLVFVMLELFVLAFKYAKYIKVSTDRFKVELERTEKEKPDETNT